MILFSREDDDRFRLAFPAADYEMRVEELTRAEATDLRDKLTAWLGDGWRTGTPDVERMDDIIIQTDDGEVQYGSYLNVGALAGALEPEHQWGDKYGAPESRRVVAWMPFPKAMAVKS